jgi:hypothetical protein
MYPIDEDVLDDVSNGSVLAATTHAISYFAIQSGILQLPNCPFVMYGFSEGGQLTYGTTRSAPNKTICSITNKSEFMDYYNSSLLNIPMLYFNGATDTASRKNTIIDIFMGGKTKSGSLPTALALPNRLPGALWCGSEEPSSS